MNKPFSEPSILIKLFDDTVIMKSVGLEWNSDWGESWSQFEK